MLVKDIMTRTIVSVAPDATVAEALDLMSRSHISGLPVVDAAGSLVGIVSEADFLRRWEIGTHGSSAGWLKALLAPGSAAQTYAKTHARHVAEMITRDVVSIDESAGLAEAVALMEKRRVKRLLVTRDGDLTGILSRADFIRALALFDPQAVRGGNRQRRFDRRWNSKASFVGGIGTGRVDRGRGQERRGRVSGDASSMSASATLSRRLPRAPGACARSMITCCGRGHSSGRC